MHDEIMKNSKISTIERLTWAIYIFFGYKKIFWNVIRPESLNNIQTNRHELCDFEWVKTKGNLNVKKVDIGGC